MKTDEEAAEEKAFEWLQTEYPLEVSLVGNVRNLERTEDYMAGFLSGLEYARTPIKIDPNDESTWPPRGNRCFVLNLRKIEQLLNYS